MKNKQSIKLNSSSQYSLRISKNNNNNKLNNNLLQSPQQSNYNKTFRKALQTSKIIQSIHRSIRTNLSQTQIKKDSLAEKAFSNIRYKNNINEKNNKKDNITNISYYKGMIPKGNKKEPVTKLVKQKENNLTSKKEDKKKI